MEVCDICMLAINYNKDEVKLLKRFKSFLNSKAFKFGSVSMFTTVLSRALNLVSIPIFARILTSDEYGRVDIFFTFANIGYIILGMASFGIVEIAFLQYKEKIDEYISSTMNLTLCNAILIGVVANAYYDRLETVIGFDRITFNVLLLYSYLIFVMSYRNVELNYRFEYKKNMLLTMSVLISNIILSIVFIKIGTGVDRSWLRVLGALIPNLFVGILIYIQYQKRGLGFIKLEYAKFTIKYALPMIPHTLSLLLLSSADRVMVKSFWGASCAGIYAISYTIGTLLYVIAEGVNKIYVPISFRKMEEGSGKEIICFQKMLVTGFGAIGCGVLCFSPELILIFGGNEYIDGQKFVMWIVFATIINFYYSIYYNVEYYYKKTVWIAIGTIICAILNILLNYVFLPIVGYQFGAISTVISYVFLLIFHMIIVRVTIKTKIIKNNMIIIASVIIFGITICVRLLLNYIVLRIGVGILSSIIFSVWMWYTLEEAKNDGVTLIQ